MKSVLQDWVQELTFMQQSVLLSAVRGPDNVEKESLAKPILRWYRRCILLSAFDKEALTDPHHPGGGNFTGPLTKSVKEHMDDFYSNIDALPFHFVTHIIHASEILGYKHPNDEIRKDWHYFYLKGCKKLHMLPEPEEQMDYRLSDNKCKWEKSEEVKKDI